MATAPSAPKDEKALIAEIEALRAKLGIVEGERDAARVEAQAMAEASVFSGGGAEEQPTGQTRKVSVCLNPWVTDEKKHKYKEVEVPLYAYTIELPPGAGTDVTTNGVAYYHGMTYEVDMDTLRDLKSRVARTWDHERAIHSENANAYRKPTNVHLRSAAAIQRGM